VKTQIPKECHLLDHPALVTHWSLVIDFGHWTTLYSRSDVAVIQSDSHVSTENQWQNYKCNYKRKVQRNVTILADFLLKNGSCCWSLFSVRARLRLGGSPAGCRRDEDAPLTSPTPAEAVTCCAAGRNRCFPNAAALVTALLLANKQTSQSSNQFICSANCKQTISRIPADCFTAVFLCFSFFSSFQLSFFLPF